MSRRTSNWLMALVLLGCAGLWWLGKQAHLRQTRQERQELAASLQQTLALTAERTAQLKATRADLDGANRHLVELLQRHRQTEERLYVLQPELKWSTPPVLLPDWKPESPFVWLSKSTLQKLHVPAVKRSGLLTEEVSAILDLKPEERRAIEAVTKKIYDEHARKEAELAEVSPNPPKGRKLRAGQQAVTLVVPPMAEYAAGWKSEWLATVQETLGPQRSDLLVQWSDWSVSHTIGLNDHEPKYISLIQTPTGYSLEVSGPGYSSSTSSSSLDVLMEGYPDQLTPQLVPRFGDLIKTSPASPAQN